jgi:DNA-binding NarL/FixJ family response regulator
MESATAATSLDAPLRLVIVDDEPLFVEMLEAMLAPEVDIEVVARAADGEEAVKLAAELDPDLVLMDISMPIMDGIEATRAIRRADPDACVLILTGGSNVADIDRARMAGAAGYLTKDRIAGELVSEIRGLGRR